MLGGVARDFSSETQQIALQTTQTLPRLLVEKPCSDSDNTFPVKLE